MGSDGSAEVAGQQDCAEDRGAGNRVQQDRDQAEGSDDCYVVSCISEVDRSLHDFGGLYKLEDAVGEHEQDDESAHDPGSPDLRF